MGQGSGAKQPAGHPFNTFPDAEFNARAEFMEELATEFSNQHAAILLLDSGIAEQVGINVSDMHALRIAWELGGCSIGTIGERLHLTSGAVTKMVDRLEAGGFVERIPDPTDRRRTIIHAIPEHVTAIGAYFDPFGMRVMTFIDDLSPDQIDLLRRWTRFSTTAALEEAEQIRNSRATSG